MTFFIASKATLIFLVGLTKFMTPKGQRFIRGRRDQLYDPKGHGDLCGQFDLVFLPQDVNRGRHDLLKDPKGHSDLCGRFDLV